MKLLILQFVDPKEKNPQPQFHPDLGSLISQMHADRMSPRAIALAGYQPHCLHQQIIQHRPRAVVAELRHPTMSFARRTFATIGEQYKIPLAVLGPQVTVDPSEACSQPGVRAAIIGEYDRSATALLRAIRDGRDPAGLPGVWIRDEDGLARGALQGPVSDLNVLPLPDRRVLGDLPRIARTGRATFAASRGCSQDCGFCRVPFCRRLYEGLGPFVRRRSPADLAREICLIRRACPSLTEAVLVDHAFASDAGWLDAFADAREAEGSSLADVTLSAYVPLADAGGGQADRLRRAGVRRVRTDIGSGSRFIRQDVFSLALSDRQIVDALTKLSQAGIQPLVRVFLGAPYETEITLVETLELLRRAKAKEVDARVYWPRAGTRSTQACRDNGWLPVRSEEDYWQGRSGLDMPVMPAGTIERVAGRFASFVRSRRGVARLRRLLARCR